MNLYLDEEFRRIWEKIKNFENITLLRYGDGERAIASGKKIKALEGWVAPDKLTSLGKAVFNSLSLDSENVYYGISCPCCDKEAYYWYRSRIKNKNITFANLFVNKNYQNFRKEFKELTRDAVFIGNFRAKNKQIGNLNILKYYFVSDDCIQFWETGAKELIEQIKEDFKGVDNLLYVVSAGPLSEPIIYELYKNNPNNTYIDFGSSIDEYIHNKKTREYMIEDSKYAKRNCVMTNIDESLDVSVVLNLYKRPQNLEKQLLAIKNQSLKPREIILHQDGVSDGSIIEIPENIKNEFDFIKVSNENKGVWERFRVARDFAKSKYVCLFDDDTIPNSRWIENCYTEMLKREGVYGAIGIVLENIEKYPVRKYFRIGWAVPSKISHEVDFVGHSWFLKTEWLEYMFLNSEELQDLKYVAEDMVLSVNLLKYLNIHTFVPPHPLKNKEFWGNNPVNARDLASKDVAVSSNDKNKKSMNLALSILVKNGWKPLFIRNKNYVRTFLSKNSFIKFCSNFNLCKTSRHKFRNYFREFLYNDKNLA